MAQQALIMQTTRSQKKPLPLRSTLTKASKIAKKRRGVARAFIISTMYFATIPRLAALGPKIIPKKMPNTIAKIVCK